MSERFFRYLGEGVNAPQTEMSQTKPDTKQADTAQASDKAEQEKPSTPIVIDRLTGRPFGK